MPLFDYPTAPATEADLEAFLAGAQAVCDAYMAKNFPTQATKLVLLPAHPQSKFRKVIDLNGFKNDDGTFRFNDHGSAWAFIEIATGLIFKPSSYKVPAKHARGTIHTASYGAEYVGPYGPAYVKDLRA